MITALTRENHSPSVLELGTIWYGLRIPDLQHWLSRRFSDVPFRNLETLCLSPTLGYCGTCTRPRLAAEKPQRTREVNQFNDYFIQALVGASQLRTLSLQIGADTPDREVLGPSVFEHLSNRHLTGKPECIPAPNLRNLELDRFDIDPVDLIFFVQKRQQTVRSLWLRNIEHCPVVSEGSDERGPPLISGDAFKKYFAPYIPEENLTWINVWTGEDWD